jgi:DNA-binding transcriptional LysR family regulator
VARDIDVGLLRAFVATAQSGSITAAARLLHLTQGGISQRIKRLETFFDCALMERGNQGSRLTARGEMLLPEAIAFIGANDRLTSRLTGEAAVELVRIGIPYDLVGTHFPPILTAFTEQYPDVEVFFVTGSSVELSQSLENGEADLIVRECVLEDSCGERLAVDRLHWVAGPGDVHLRRLLPLSFVSQSCVFRPAVYDSLKAADIGWKVLYDNNSIEATAATVRSDLALTTWLASAMPGNLRILGAEAGLPVLPDFAIELHMAAGPLSAPVQALAVLIRQHYWRDVI